MYMFCHQDVHICLLLDRDRSKRDPALLNIPVFSNRYTDHDTWHRNCFGIVVSKALHLIRPEHRMKTVASRHHRID
jgi:hypothetical protein